MTDLKICLQFGQLKSVTRNGPVDGRIFQPRFLRFNPVEWRQQSVSALTPFPVSGPVLVDEGVQASILPVATNILCFDPVFFAHPFFVFLTPFLAVNQIYVNESSFLEAFYN